MIETTVLTFLVGVSAAVAAGDTGGTTVAVPGHGPNRVITVARALTTPDGAPSAAPTVAFGFSLDGGANYFYDEYPTTNTSPSDFLYNPPDLSTHVAVSVTNNDNAAKSLGLFAQIAAASYG